MGFFCDLDGTNFYKFYGRFEDIGVLHVMSVFYWLYKFDLDTFIILTILSSFTFSKLTKTDGRECM